MKKLFAILLILALLLPMGMGAHAEAVETRPFYLVNWTTFDGEYTNVYYMPYLFGHSASIKEGQMPEVSWNSWNTSDISTIAQRMKDTLNAYPAGARYINFTLPASAFDGLAEDACILDKGIPVIQQWLDKFLFEFYSLGGKLDGLVLDIEYLHVYGSYIHDDYYTKDPLIYDKIVKNPVYQNKIRPQLVERGFKFYDKITERTPEIYSIYPNSGTEYALSRSIWDTVMRSYANLCITEACAPVWKYYPDASVSDYQSKSNKPWLKNVSDKGGTLGSGGIQFTAGNCSNENFYFNRPGTTFFNDSSTPDISFKKMPTFNDVMFENTIFNRFLFDIFIAKNSYLAADDGNVSWWLDPYIRGTSNSPFYAETILHLGMLDPKVYQGYILMQDVDNDKDKYAMALQVVDDCLKELTRMVGAADRKPIYIEPNWNHNFVLSGMYAGGKNVWRLTPNTDKISIMDFKVNDADPTFCIDGETISFPKGKIIQDGLVTDIGTCGYWIETPTDVMPVITRAEEYYRAYAPYAEDYERYDAGMDYHYNAVWPQGLWEMQKSGGGIGTVMTDPANGDNQVLAVKGNFALKNIIVPKNITAADTYAKHQAWEVTFTLPSDMGAEGELTLLDAGLEKKKIDDGGFKIAGGKAYYYNNGEYVELAGVTLAPGTRYTAIRELDFSSEGAFTSDFYLYDADGKLLGKALDIPMAAFTLPVYSISMSCKKISGEPVLLDDYKLYPTDVAVDFYLYDATTGMAVDEKDQARAGNTAYRVSWLNATGEEKIYTVMAAYYEGETLVSEELVKEVKLAPNADGVITGIVNNETGGRTVRVYLQAGDADETFGNVLMMAIVAAVVVAVAVIIVVMVRKKKKTDVVALSDAAAEAKEENEESTDA